MAKKIQDGSILYYSIRSLVNFTVGRSFRKFQVEGLENIPKEGCTIWACNHTNALMEPLVMLKSTFAPKVYLARADIFRKPFVVKLLTFLKIMPIYRIRDGIGSVKRNDEIIERAVDVLQDGVPLVIFPEATHRAKHSLLKLSKGVFHIAMAVDEKCNGSKPVYILPVGLDYGDYFRFHSTVLVRFGNPIDVSAYLRDNSELTQPQQMQVLRDELTRRMAQIITFVPDDNDYDAVWEYAKLRAADRQYFKKALAESESTAGRRFKGLERIQAVNRHAVAGMLKMKDSNPEGAAELLQKIDEQRVWRIQNGVSVRSIGGNVSWLTAISKALLALVGLPYFLFCMTVCSIVWVPTLLIISRVDDDAFYNTARFGVKFALSWVYFLLFGILFFKLLPFVPALILTLLLVPAHRYFYDFLEFGRRCLSDFRWLLSRRRREQKIVF